MQAKIKQRWIGVLILLAMLAIFLPLIFHNERPEIKKETIPALPPQPKIEVNLKVSSNEKSTAEAVAPENAPTETDQKLEITESKPVIQKPIETQSKPVPVVQQPQSPKEVNQEVNKNFSSLDSQKKVLANYMEAPQAWTIQLGTFSNINNANKLVAQLRKAGFDVYSHSISDLKTGKQMVRVYVGPEIKKENALQLKDQLQSRFHLRGILQEYKVKT